MTKKNTSKHNRKRAYVVLLIAVLLVAAALLIIFKGRLFGLNDSSGTEKWKRASDTVYFDAGANAMLAELDGSLTLADGRGIQVFDKRGQRTLSELFIMETPAVVTNGTKAIAYSPGGDELRVFSDSKILVRLHAEGPIISASISDSGMIAVCTSDSVYKGLVTVYSATGEAVYRWYSGEGYILSSVLPHKDGELAVLTLTEKGSRIVFLKTDDASYTETVEIDGEVIIDAEYSDKGGLTAVSDDALFFIKSGGEYEMYKFDGRYLGGYTLDSGFTAVLLRDFHTGGKCELISFNDRGGIKATEEITDARSFSAASGYAAILTESELLVFDDALNVLCRTGGVDGYTDVIMRNDGSVFAAGPSSADVFRD